MCLDLTSTKGARVLISEKSNLKLWKKLKKEENKTTIFDQNDGQTVVVFAVSILYFSDGQTDR